MEFVREIVVTCLLLMVIWSNGFNEGSLSAGLPDLAFLTSSSTDEIATIYTWRNIAGALGSFAMGKAIDRYDGMLVIGSGLIVQAIFTLLTPWCPDLIGVSTVSAFAAFFLGGITVCSFVVIYRTWVERLNWARPIVQLQGVFYIFGSAVAPLAVSPFLGITSAVLPLPNNSTLLLNMSLENATIVQDTKVATGFGIASVIGFVFGILCCVEVIVFGLEQLRHTPQRKQSISTSTGAGKNDDIHSSIGHSTESKTASFQTSANTSSLSRWPKHVTVPVGFYLVFMVVFGGIEMTLLGLTVTYTEVYLGWTVFKSALSSTVLQSARLVTVIITIFIINFFYSFNIIILDCAILVFGSTVWLVFFKFTDSITWTGLIFMGIGTANVYATSMSVANDITPISGTLGAMFNMAYCIGGLAFPPLAGYLLESSGTWTFTLLILCCSFICLTFAILARISMSRLNRQSLNTKVTVDEKQPLVSGC